MTEAGNSTLEKVDSEENALGAIEEDSSAEKILEKINRCFGNDVAKAFQGENIA